MTWADRLWPVRRWVGRVEVREVRWLGRSGLGLFARTPVLVLETVGRRTGRHRSTVVACIPTGEGWLIAGGAGGQTSVDWVANLRACREAEIVVSRKRLAVLAHEVTDADLREVALTRWPRIRTYEARSGRTTPIFLLRPR